MHCHSPWLGPCTHNCEASPSNHFIAQFCTALVCIVWLSINVYLISYTFNFLISEMNITSPCCIVAFYRTSFRFGCFIFTHRWLLRGTTFTSLYSSSLTLDLWGGTQKYADTRYPSLVRERGKKGGRGRERDGQTQAGWKLGNGNSMHFSHESGKNAITWTITCCLTGYASAGRQNKVSGQRIKLKQPDVIHEPCFYKVLIPPKAIFIHSEAWVFLSSEKLPNMSRNIIN